MAVKLRLKRMGAKQKPFYRIVAADSRSPRDGRFIETVGTYNPVANPAEVKIDKEIALKWLNNGAEPTDTVKSLLKKEGILKEFNDAINTYESRCSSLTSDIQFKINRLSEVFSKAKEKQKEIKNQESLVEDLSKEASKSETALEHAVEDAEAVLEQVSSDSEQRDEKAKEFFK